MPRYLDGDKYKTFYALVPYMKNLVSATTQNIDVFTTLFGCMFFVFLVFSKIHENYSRREIGPREGWSINPRGYLRF